MKRILLVFAATFCLAAFGPPAAGAGLGSQVRALQKQVKALQKQVKALKKADRVLLSESDANYDGDACETALVADLFQATWTGLNSAFGHTVFVVPARVDDRGTCQIGVARSTAITFAPFVSYVKWVVTGQA